MQWDRETLRLTLYAPVTTIYFFLTSLSASENSLFVGEKGINQGILKYFHILHFVKSE